MASVIPKAVKKEITDGWLAASETVWKVALLLTTYTWNTAHDEYSDVSGWEHPNGTGYTTGGETLAGRVSTQSGENYFLDATDLSWGPGATLTGVGYAVVYETTGGKIRAIYDLGGSKSCTSSTFTLMWDANGLILVS